jgi:hypothetical protein
LVIKIIVKHPCGLLPLAIFFIDRRPNKNPPPPAARYLPLPPNYPPLL